MIPLQMIYSTCVTPCGHYYSAVIYYQFYLTRCSADGADDKDAKEGDQDKDEAMDEDGGDGKFEYVTGDQKGSSQVCIRRSDQGRVVVGL